MFANFSFRHYSLSSPALASSVDLHGEFEALENVADIGRKALHISREMRPDVVLVADQLRQVQDRRVVKALPGLAQQKRLGIESDRLLRLQLRQHRRLGRLQNAIEAAENGERQDDLAVIGLLVIAAQQVRDRPDKGGQGLMIHESPPIPQFIVLMMTAFWALWGSAARWEPPKSPAFTPAPTRSARSSHASARRAASGPRAH